MTTTACQCLNPLDHPNFNCLDLTFTILWAVLTQDVWVCTVSNIYLVMVTNKNIDHELCLWDQVQPFLNGEPASSIPVSTVLTSLSHNLGWKTASKLLNVTCTRFPHTVNFYWLPSFTDIFLCTCQLMPLPP